MDLDAELIRLQDLVHWIDDQTKGLRIEHKDDRERICVGCFDVAVEQQAAMGLLFSYKLYGAAFSMLRLLFESTVRGMWFSFCATDEQVQKFKKRGVDEAFGDLIDQIEAALGTPAGVLSSFKKASWRMLNDFTHTGFQQVTRRYAEGRIEGNYPDDEVVRAMRTTGALGLIAGQQLGVFAKDNELVGRFKDKTAEYAASGE
jgi:hypothetical protein